MIEEHGDRPGESGYRGDGGSVRSGAGRPGLNGRTGNKGKDGEREVEWENVLGFRAEALEKMLSPGRAFNKRRFEVGVEGCVFVGAPMFVREDGGWKKSKKAKQKDRDVELANGETAPNENSKGESNDEQAAGTGQSVDLTQDQTDITELSGFEPGYGHGNLSPAASRAPSEADSDTKSAMENDMTMFNVVFVLNPPALEYQIRVKEMYDNVVRKFAKALKYQQAKNNYVWRESREIIAAKNKGKENSTYFSIGPSFPMKTNDLL